MNAPRNSRGIHAGVIRDRRQAGHRWHRHRQRWRRGVADPRGRAAPRRADAAGDRTPLDEDQARAFLTAFNGAHQARPSIRKLADAWCWHRSKVERFLSRFDAETQAETARETPNGTLLPMDLPKTETPKKADENGVHDFDWYSEGDADSVVLTEQRRTAIYWNRSGEMVIRQQNDHDGDQFVFVTEENARQLAFKLCEFLELEMLPGRAGR
jgi:hypothetical protein